MASYVIVKPAYFKGKRYGIGQVVDDSVVHNERAAALIRMNVIAKVSEESEKEQETDKTTSSEESKEQETDTTTSSEE